MDRKYVFILIFFALGLSACDSNDSDGDGTLRLSFNGLDPLTNGFHYEGWAVIGGSATTTGKFNISATGAIVDLSGSAIANGEFDTGLDLDMATTFILTIEPSGDTDTVPSSTHLVGGDFAGDTASLSIAHGSSLGSDFTGATGDYILATPTNGADNDENSGIWFLDLSSGSPEAGLSLPTLPAGWLYEGWVVIDGTPVTSGTFTSASGVDDADPFSGVEAGPPFPGEDYLVNAPTGLSFPTDLAGMTAVISIEPSPDSDPGPFTLKPLVGQIPGGALDHTVYSMDNNATASSPSGTARVVN